MTRGPRSQSLRTKLTLVTLVTVVMVQLCAAIVLISWERSRARRNLVETLQTQSRIVVDNSAAALSFGDHDAALETLRSLRVNEGFERACLYDEHGMLFADEVLTGACSPAPVADGSTVESGLAVSTPVSAPSRGQIGTLTLQSSLKPVNDRLRDQIVGTLVVLLLSALAAVLLMTRLRRLLTLPLQHLAETAQAVSRDRDYSRRVRKEGDDEVGAVSEAVNHMLSQIQERDEDLQNALRLKDEFLATVSHELRTPLNAMLGWSHVLRGDRLTPAMTAQAAEAIDRNAHMQARLIEDILDVSRIITGKMRLEPVNTDLVAIVRSAVDVVLPSAQAKTITIQTTLPAQAAFVGDPDRLRQVVWNLVSNAVKFTSQEGAVRVTVAETAAEYRIEVADTGRGIAPDFLPYIFQPFRQADGSFTRSQGGLGLGLAIARHLTELSGGSIRADSAGLNMGSTFTIRLPHTSPQTSPPLPPREQPAAHAPRRPDLRTFRILVVDDNEDTRHFLGNTLRALGADVRTASSVPEAREQLSAGVPDVLITDLAMPTEDGFRLLEHCRRHADARVRTLPILALTAYAGQQQQARVLAAGFDAYLAKPAEPPEVARVVRELRDGRSGDRPEGIARGGPG